tara:strand:+ start:5222 stop:6115 length:894 start_codon:yes stop_codon:yes gene_type:complete
MSYDSKVAAARQIIDTHNSNAIKSIPFDDFLKKLQELGGTSEDALKLCSFEDLEKAGLPRLIARQVAKIFRGETAGDSDSKASSWITKKKAEQLTPRELLERFDPKEHDTALGNRLKAISNGKSFWVLNDDGSIDVEISVKLLNEVREGFEPRDMYVEDGKEPRNVYAVGQRPDVFVDLNPIYGHRVLRPDGTCDQTNRSWDGIPLEVRQVVYLARKNTGEVEVTSLQDAHDVMDKIVGVTDITVLSARMPKAVSQLRQLQKSGDAPSMKKPISSSKESGKRFVFGCNDPFGTHKTY